MYSDKINSPINIDEKITSESTRYLRFEKTRRITDVI